MTDYEEKVSKLPVWARDHIKYLQTRNEPYESELISLRNQVENLKRRSRLKDDQIQAMVEMFKCAANGGNEVAAAVQRIVEDYIVSDDE